MSGSSEQKLALPALIALVVGSMIGAGIFSLPATFGRATGGAGALIAWAIAGAGMLMLAFVFQSLAQRKPDLDAGVYAYAKDGFGEYMGFAAAFGFWSGTCVGNTFYFILIMTTLGAFFPVLGEGNTLVAVICSSAILWAFHFTISRGVQGAAAINKIVTVAKMVPIFIFLIILLFHFDTKIFMDNFLGNPTAATVLGYAPDALEELKKYGQVGYHATLVPVPVENESLMSQVRSTMLVTVFVFIGIEGASVYSRLAQKREDVGTATVVGFFFVMATLILVTMLSFGVIDRYTLANLRQPSMGELLSRIVGPWGAIFVSVGLIVSVLGAFLSWTLLAAEMLYVPAKEGVMPKFLSDTNENGVPVKALVLSNLFVQVLLVATMFSAYAFTLALELTSSLTLIPYFLAAAYAFKLAQSGETYEGDPTRTRELVIGLIATAYTVLMIYAGGFKYVLLSAVIYAPGTYLFFMARREKNQSVFTPTERIIFGITAAAAVYAVYDIAVNGL